MSDAAPETVFAIHFLWDPLWSSCNGDENHYFFILFLFRSGDQLNLLIAAVVSPSNGTPTQTQRTKPLSATEWLLLCYSRNPSPPPHNAVGFQPQTVYRSFPSSVAIGFGVNKRLEHLWGTVRHEVGSSSAVVLCYQHSWHASGPVQNCWVRTDCSVKDIIHNVATPFSSAVPEIHPVILHLLLAPTPHRSIPTPHSPLPPFTPSTPSLHHTGTLSLLLTTCRSLILHETSNDRRRSWMQMACADKWTGEKCQPSETRLAFHARCSISDISSHI